MGSLGKILAFLNIVAALAFVYLAVVDWAQRTQWSYAVFREDLAIQGLPLDQGTVNPADDTTQVFNLDSAGLQAIFQGVGDPVQTQHEEVKRVQQSLTSALGKLDEASRRQQLKNILVPLARTGETRDALIQKIDTANLANLLGPNGPFDRVFQAALRDKQLVVADLTGPGKKDVVDPYEWALGDIPADKTQDSQELLAPEQQRSLVAHLLFNLPATFEPVQRALIVTGLKAYAEEGNSQALALEGMADRLRSLLAGDRSTFVLNHQRAIQDLEVLARTLADRTAFLARQKETLEKHQRLIEARQTEINGSEDGKIKGLLTQLNEARGRTQVLLQQLADEQQSLFVAQNVVGAGQANNERLLREMEKIERANLSPER